jgi:hypothetical protein
MIVEDKSYTAYMGTFAKADTPRYGVGSKWPHLRFLSKGTFWRGCCLQNKGHRKVSYILLLPIMICSWCCFFDSNHQQSHHAQLIIIRLIKLWLFGSNIMMLQDYASSEMVAFPHYIKFLQLYCAVNT